MSDAATNEKIISLGTLSHNNDKMKEYIQNEIDKIPYSNILDNSNFKINQRGQTTYSGDTSSYSVDRWTISGLNLSVLDDGINITDSNNGWIQQMVENVSDFSGMPITISALIDGEILFGTTTVPTTISSSNTIDTANSSIKFTVAHYNNDRLRIAVIISSTSCHISWVKAEIGSNATPFTPPNQAEELIKSQRYFNSLFVNNGIPVQFLGTGIAVSNNVVVSLINLPNTMRIPTPTVTLTGTLYLVDGTHSGDNSIEVQGVVASYLNRNVLQLNLSTSSGITLDRSVTYLLSRRDIATVLTVSAEL